MVISTFPSLFQITITWDPPERPNGNIIAYEVSYEPTDSSEPVIRMNTTANFSTLSNLELGSEYMFSVTAYTRVGPGNTTSVTVSTLSSIREKMLDYLNCIPYHNLSLLQLLCKGLK